MSNGDSRSQDLIRGRGRDGESITCHDRRGSLAAFAAASHLHGPCGPCWRGGRCSSRLWTMQSKARRHMRSPNRSLLPRLISPLLLCISPMRPATSLRPVPRSFLALTAHPSARRSASVSLRPPRRSTGRSISSPLSYQPLHTHSPTMASATKFYDFKPLDSTCRRAAPRPPSERTQG